MGLREEKKAEQRRAILDAAAALFRKRGYEQTRVRDIIERLRISEVTFFNYFPSKDALIAEFALDQYDFSIASVKSELARHDCSVPDRIRSLMRQWARAWDAEPEFFTLVATRSRMLSEPEGLLREKALQLYELYKQLFSEGQKRREIRNDQKPLDLAEMLEGMVTIIAGNWAVGWWKDRSDPLEERFMNAVTVFLEGCGAAQLQSTRKEKIGGTKQSTPSIGRR